MKIKYLVKKFFNNFYLTIAFSLAMFIFVLTVFLDMKLALLSLFVSFALGVLSRSFSKGWLLILFLFLILPSVRFYGDLNFQYILLALMALIGIVAASFQRAPLYLPRISRFFIIFMIIVGGLAVYAWFSRVNPGREIFLTCFTLIAYWIIFSIFTYFFQTLKRIKKFFGLLVGVGILHAMFGVLAFILVHQFFGNLGVSFSIIDYPGIGRITYNLNGFLGDGFLLKVGVNALAPLLLITSSITLGFILTIPKREIEVEMLDKRGRLNRKALVDSAFSQVNFDVENIRKELVRVFSLKVLLVLAFLIQSIALFLTFSFLAMVSFSLGFLIVGILLRKKTVIYASTILIFTFTLFLPSINEGNLTKNSVKNLNSWLIGLESIKESWVLGNSWNIDKNYELRDNLRIYNSYLLIWSVLGLAGLLVFVGALADYFYMMLSVYKKSEGENRIWMIIIISIFFQLLLCSIGSNAIIFGPSALAFWLLYAVTVNLKKKNTVFGLTETKLDWS